MEYGAANMVQIKNSLVLKIMVQSEHLTQIMRASNEFETQDYCVLTILRSLLHKFPTNMMCGMDYIMLYMFRNNPLL